MRHQQQSAHPARRAKKHNKTTDTRFFIHGARPARSIVAFGGFSAALLAGALLSSPAASAAVTGGSWFANAGNGSLTPCAAGVAGDDYVGACSKTADSKNADVKLDSSTDIAKKVIGGYSVDGTASDNTVEIQNGTISDRVMGGNSINNAASGNKVTISGGTMDNNVHGGLSGSGNANGNTVDISGGKVKYTVSGGYSSSANANGNTVTISDTASIGTSVTGGSSLSGGDAKNNTVNISGGSIGMDVTGGSGSDVVTDNKVNISGGTIQQYVYGGRNWGPTGVADNAVTITGGDLKQRAYGGWSDAGKATGNSLSISGATTTIDGTVFGGWSTQDVASGNTVDIAGGTIGGGFTYGGYSKDKNATDNTITISGGTLNSEVIGGYSSYGDTTGNTVEISAGTLKSYVYGGYSYRGDAIDNTVRISGGAQLDMKVYGGRARNGDTVGNQVIISGGTTDYMVYGGITKTGNASNNTVTISSGSIGNDVTGGSSEADATGNEVNITGGIVRGFVRGAYSVDGDASNNSVTISGGSIGSASGGSSISGDASNNTVTISGGTINGDIYGGYLYGTGQVTGNRVILAGAPTFGPTTVIAGGNDATNFSGNVLEMHTKGLTAANVESFAEYHFLLPAGTQNGDTVLTLTDAGGTDLSNADVGVAIQSGSNVLTKGDQVALVHNANGVNTTGVTQTSLTGYQGIALKYNFTLDDDANNLYAVVAGGGAAIRDQAKAPVEGRIGALGLLQQSGNLDQVLAVDGDGVFGFLTGDSLRYDSGSHVDADSAHLVIGGKRGFANAGGALTAAVFVEGGWGSYDTYNSFASGTVRGSGNASYGGAGFTLRQDWDSGLYVQGLLHGGRISSDWSSNDMGVANASYDISTPYYGAQAGVGYVIALSEASTLDLSAQYLWTHLGSEKTDVGGSPYHFESVDSNRSQLGAHINHAFNERFSGRAGLAWEHEFSGTARASVHGLDTAAPSIKGDTGIVDVGFSAKPSADSALTLDASAQGYVGRRQGIGGKLGASWAFD